MEAILIILGFFVFGFFVSAMNERNTRIAAEKRLLNAKDGDGRKLKDRMKAYGIDPKAEMRKGLLRGIQTHHALDMHIENVRRQKAAIKAKTNARALVNDYQEKQTPKAKARKLVDNYKNRK